MERKGILQFAKACLTNPDYYKTLSGNLRAIKLLEDLLLGLYRHYGFCDIEKGTRHQMRFSLLYLDFTGGAEKNDVRQMTFEEIAEETFIGVDGLKKCVKRYNRTALAYMTEESRVDTDYAFILQKFKESGL